jgi:hypothetical protein
MLTPRKVMLEEIKKKKRNSRNRWEDKSVKKKREK